MSGNGDVGNLENSLPSWISDHLGQKSYMMDEVNQLPFSLRVETFDNPVDNRPTPKREIKIITQGDLYGLRESCSFLTGI